MDDAINAAACAMSAIGRQIEIATENAVNAQTPGYVNRVLSMRSFQNTLSQEMGGASTLVQATETHGFQPGILVPSPSPFAVALKGPGFLAIQAPDGVVYTKNGDLTLSRDGTLMTRAGYPVLGANGPIRAAPAAGTARFDARSGHLVQDGRDLGALRLVEFDRPDLLERVGTTLFSAPPEALARTATATEIVAGSLEIPPERAVAGLVGLIAASRDFEAAQRVTSVISRTYERLLGRGG